MKKGHMNALEIAFHCSLPPACPQCGNKPELVYELPPCAYKGRFRLECSCGREGDWFPYEEYNCSVAEYMVEMRKAGAAWGRSEPPEPMTFVLREGAV